MNILLDTHVILWLVNGNDDLPKNIVEIIEDANNQIYYSMVSFMEVAIKISINKLSNYSAVTTSICK